MRILFFFVHPAKYHLFKHTINHLIDKGHRVDIVIITKDILEDLVKDEGWEYTNIFPEGRRSIHLPILAGTFVNFLKTIVRLCRYSAGKQYDLFVTDDLLVAIGRMKGVPTLLFQDDDLAVVPESALLMALANHIVAPRCSKMGMFEKKKIAYTGNHEWAYLHPEYFTADFQIVESFNPDKRRYFILRLVSLTASHDRGKSGITNDFAGKLIRLLERHGNVYITSERELPGEFEKYRICINPADIAHALYYAEMFIGDSQTMTSEAAVLGTPSIRFNDFVGRISYIEEEEHRFGLTYGFKTHEFDKLFGKVQQLLWMQDLKAEWQRRLERLRAEYIDVTDFFIRLIENYSQGQYVE